MLGGMPQAPGKRPDFGAFAQNASHSAACRWSAEPRFASSVSCRNTLSKAWRTAGTGESAAGSAQDRDDIGSHRDTGLNLRGG